MFADRLLAKKVRLDWPEGDEATVLQVDEVSFKTSVLGNIVSNAIKFTDVDSTIEVRCRHVNDRVRIGIRDSGRGMSADQIKEVFSTDKATTSSGTQGESGTGFGMPLVKFYVDVYGGRIHLESKTQADSPSDQIGRAHV